MARGQAQTNVYFVSTGNLSFLFTSDEKLPITSLMRHLVFFFFLILFATATACRANITPSSPPPSDGTEDGADDPAGDPETTGDEEDSNVPLTAENWTVVYDGYGKVTFGTEILLEPMAPSEAGETHAALALAKATETEPLDNFCLTIEATTEEQLRSPAPNPWEVFWIFFNYLPDGDFKETNYFTLKTNGIELGRAFGSTDQEFLVTVDAPNLTLGTRNTFVLEKSPGRVVVRVDGIEVIDFQNQEDPDILYDHPGAIGLYTEDARVRIHAVNLDCPSNS